MSDVQDVADRLRPVLFRLERELAKEASALGVTSRQVTLLGLLKAQHAISLRQIATQDRISPAALSGHIVRLERAKLIERVRHEEDVRRVDLRLTQAGEQCLRRLRTRRTTWLVERLRKVSDPDLAALSAAIEPLRKIFP